MRRIIVLIVALLLIQSVMASDDFTLRKDLTLQLMMDSQVGVDSYSANARIDSVEVKMNYKFEDDSNQEIISLITTPQAEIDDKIIFFWKTPTTFPLVYSVKTILETNGEPVKVTRKVVYPIKSYSTEVYEYTKPTSMIDINDDIRRQAAIIAGESDDQYEIVSNLAIWTKQNVRYDLSSVAADAVQTSSWVLKNKVGVCDEITNLFISMSRSLGIPARFVTGISYTNDPQFEDAWGLHGWAEVYFEGYGWVPFDPTYGELGFVDAGHIKLRDSLDSNKSTTEYKWASIGADIRAEKLNFDVEVLSKGDLLSPAADISVQAFDDSVGFGSYNYVEATIQNDNDYYTTLDITLSVPKEVEVLSEKTRAIVLLPHEKKAVYFAIRIPSTLDKGYRYTYPIAITTNRNYTVESQISVEHKQTMIDYATIAELIRQKESATDIGNAVSFFCISNTNEAGYLENITVLCTLQNNKDERINADVCTPDECKIVSASARSEESVIFLRSYNTSGYKLLSITARNDDIEKQDFITIMVLDTPKVKISGLTYPKTVSFKDNFKIAFNMTKESYATPKNAKVRVFHNKNNEQWLIGDIEGIQPFVVELPGEYLRFNDNAMKAVVEFQDNDGKTYLVEQDFSIILENTTFLEKLQVILNQAGLWIQRLIKL